MFTKWEHLSNNTSKGFNSPSDQSSKSKSQISAGQMGMGRRHLVTDGIQLCCGWEGSRLPLTTAHRRIYSLVTIDDITLQEVTFESVRIGRSSVIGGWGGGRSGQQPASWYQVVNGLPASGHVARRTALFRRGSDYCTTPLDDAD